MHKQILACITCASLGLAWAVSDAKAYHDEDDRSDWRQSQQGRGDGPGWRGHRGGGYGPRSQRDEGYQGGSRGHYGDYGPGWRGRGYGPGGRMGEGGSGRMGGSFGMMGPGMMGSGMMGPVMMRMMFSLMDTDNDGAVSLAEFQAAHERMFKSLDANKDGRLTIEELQAVMRGQAETAAQDSPPAGKPQQ